MMNKKRLAALAMSAVMAAGTVSIPVNAADFSDGAAVQEATAEVQSVDVTEDAPDAVGATVTSVEEKEWKNTETTTPTLIVTVKTDEDTTGKDYEVTTGFTKQPVNATCTQEGGYTWTVTYMGYTFVSDFVKTAEKTDHEYEEVKTIKTHPNCATNTPGTMEIVEKCKNCDAEKPDSNRTETIPVSHSWEGEATVTYSAGTNTKLVNNDNSIVPVLDNKGKPGSYVKITSQYCKACKKTIETRETINLPAEETIRGTKIKISEVKNIANDGFAAINDINNIPKEEDIKLTDCTKDGSYVITYLDENNDELDSVSVTVKAHHVMKVTKFAYVNDEDKTENYLAVSYENDGTTPILDKDGHLIVVNNTCLKDVDYYEISTCTVCGKNETKVQKTAPKSDKHVVDTSVKTKLEGLKANASNKYDDVLTAIGGEDSKFAKIVNVTATCEKAGTVDVELTCKVCGEKAATVAGIKVDALGHKYTTKAENVKEATCTTSGSYVAVTVCERCGVEKERKDIIIKRLAHTNETSVNSNGEGTDNTASIKDSDASIQFVGSLVFGKNGGYSVGQELGTEAGDKYTVNGAVVTDGTVIAKVITNCAVCHNHEVALTTSATIKVKAVTKETTNVVSGKVTAPGSITLVATYTEAGQEDITKEITLPYFSKAMDTTLAYTGLYKDVDGVYRYYEDGDFAEDYVGMVNFDGKDFYIENGVISTDTNGIKLVGDEFYFFAYGQVQNYTGIAQYDGEFFSVVNGELNTDVSGLVDYDGGTFLFADGRLVKEHNGLWQNFDGDWYYLANGQVQKQYTGLALYDGEWFYVVNGVLDDDYNGTVEYDGAEFKVVNGMVQ